jgi:pimeloyl-ACP methyl ester carboxylesterase
MAPATTALHVTMLGEGEPVLLIHGSLTSSDPADDDWLEQRPLAERYQLLMAARRGYGESPARPPGYGFAEESDELARLLGDGAHLVGFSYGGFLALLMAARRPEAVRSLTLIEPAALSVARGNPDVEALIARLRPIYPAPIGMTPEEFLLAFRRALRALPPDTPLDLTDEDRQNLAWDLGRRGVEATMREQPQWEAEIPLDTLAAAPFPRLIFSGGWSPALDAICDALEAQLRAERVVVAGAGHAVQLTGQPFNERLQAFLTAAAQSR